jgi:environmental stress-induced protein Ves
MAVSAARARDLTLSLHEVSEAPHWQRVAFRTPRKIFATLDAEARDLNLMFDQDMRDFYCEQAPHAFSPVPGGWGQRGATRCDLLTVDEADLISALHAAHKLAAPKPAAPSSRRKLPLPRR